MAIIIIGLVVFGLICTVNKVTGIIGIVLSVLLTMFPIEGFEKQKCVEKINLIPLKDSSTYITVRNFKTRYIKKVGNKVTFAYDNREKYEIDGKLYEETYVKGNIKIYESQDCTQPCLKIFVKKPYRGLLAFAPFSTKTEYIFYLPEDDEEVDKSEKIEIMKETIEIENV